MLYRTFGKTNEVVSNLGFGCMRFKVIDGKQDQIDEENAIKQIRYAIDEGVNYIDTAYPYHQGESERVVGKALLDGYREKIFLATKLPSWLIEKREDMDRYLNEQLAKLQTNYIDFYLVHALNKDFWSNLTKNDLFEFLDSIKADGRVRHVGFSFHDELPLFKEIVDAYDWEFCQIQYNLLDENYQAGLEGLNYAYERGLGIVIMEPLRGGKLVKTIPTEVKSLYEAAGTESPAAWALKFLWDNPKISVILSGMTEDEHIKENIEIASSVKPNSLTTDEHQMLKDVKDIYHSKIRVDCTSCNYCMPCPHGVNIPKNFSLWNEASLFDDLTGYKEKYSNLSPDEQASSCVACGECIPKCPQSIPIIDSLQEVVQTFE